MLGSDTDARRARTERTRSALLVAALMVAGTFVGAAAPATAWHSDMPVVHEETSPGSTGFGVSADVQETGDVSVAVTGWAPSGASQISAGVAVYDAGGDLVFLLAFTAHGSPDRTIVSPSPVEPTASGSWEDGAWSTHAQGDASVLEDTEIKIEVLPQDGPTPAGEHPVIRLATTTPDHEPGPYNRVVWVGDVGSSTLQVETETSVGSIETTTGPSHVLGDPEIEQGTPNVQYQDSQALPETVGVKVMNDASVEVDAEEGLLGFWGLSDFKLACQFSAGACLWASNAYALCGITVGANCSPGQISWQGPSDSGDGGTLHALDGTDPGPHTFTVDHKVDLYGPSLFHGGSGTWVSLGEHFSYLTVADVGLP